MELSVPLPFIHQTTIIHKIPPHLNIYKIAGAYPTYTIYPGGDFLCQEIEIPDIHIQLNVCCMNRDGWLYFHTITPLCILVYMLEREATCKLKGIKETAVLTPALCHLFYIPGGVKHKAFFKEGVCVGLHIDLSPRILKKLSGYQDIRKVMELAGRNARSAEHQQPSFVHSEVRMFIKQILDCPEEGRERNIYLEAKVLELLRLHEKDKVTGDYRDIHGITQKIYEVRDYIYANLDKPLTISVLSRQAGISDFMLKKAFKQSFQRTVHAFIHEQRLQRAHQLLSETDLPIKQIAAMTGMKGKSAFTTAFHKRFGLTPGELRKHRRYS